MAWGMESGLAALAGLLLGSFLNVVIHRLPQMLERQWDAECQAHLAHRGHASPLPVDASAPLNLAHPRSHCPHCGRPLRWYENVPVFSYLALRGRCAGCRQRISLRYPLVELATAALCAYGIARWGLTPAGMAWSGLGATLLTLALIDWDTTLLPDSLTVPLVWAGVLAAALGWTGTTLSDAVWGAAGGYGSLWLVYWAFKLATGKEGMGYGDFKLFAALGAWFGWQALVPIILMSSVMGALVGIALQLRQGLREGGYMPFGPFLAGAGGASLVWGDRPVQALLGIVGL